jgi:hypoxanthine phosphoribosyltransferase
MSDIATVLFTEEEIRQRIRELGGEITRDYSDRSPVLVTVLKGAVMFLADLFREIDRPARVDFMSISPYGRDSEEAGGVVRIMKDLDQDIGGEDVVVVEDIVDTGLTLSYLLTTLWSRQPRSIEVCALLDKSVRRIPNVDIRYRGFDCPDKFVVGYGMDHAERYRNLPAILSVEDRSQLGEQGEAFDDLLEASAAERPVAP